MTNKPPLNLTPRDFWLKDRALNCIEALNRFSTEEDWIIFKQKITEFSKELTYCMEEWDKYYSEIKTKLGIHI
jgi:hypothetical protein